MATDANGFPIVSWNGYSNAPGHTNPNGVTNAGGAFPVESARDATELNRYGFADGTIPEWVAKDAADAKFSGKMTRGDFDAWRLEAESGKEAREFEQFLADTAWQRKVADVKAAGFSPLAALEASGQGAAVPTAHVASATSKGSNMNLGGVIGAVVAAIAMIASKGMASAASAKTATEVAAIKAQNKLALAALRRRW